LDFWLQEAGGDRLYSGTIEIDDDVREEYWNEIRHLPDRKSQKLVRCVESISNNSCGRVLISRAPDKVAALQ
jgi:hypothetical protein